MLNKLFLMFFVVLFSTSVFAEEKYVNFCKIYNPKKAIEYETHTKISEKFCIYYLDQCNEKYNNKCKIEMNGYYGLYNTNSMLAKLHVLYNDDFDRGQV